MKNRMMNALLRALTVSVCCALIVWASQARRRAQTADVEATLDSGGIKRSFLAHSPASPPKGKPLPLVIALHGGGGQGKGINKLTGFNELADRQGVVVVYPDGVDRNWNDGRSTVRRKDVDDVRFLGELNASEVILAFFLRHRLAR